MIYKGHSQFFQNYNGHGIGTSKKFRDRAVVENIREEFDFDHNMHVERYCRLVNYILV